MRPIGLMAHGPCRPIPTLVMQVDGCVAHPCPRKKVDMVLHFCKEPSSPTWACWADPSPSLGSGMK